MLDAGADVILLDNFPLPALRRALALINGRALTARIPGGAQLSAGEVLVEVEVEDLSDPSAPPLLSLTHDGLAERDRLVFELCEDLRAPCVVFMGGGYSTPISESVAAFVSLFEAAARAHQRLLALGAKGR